MQAINYTKKSRVYTEIIQKNPINWCILHPDGDSFVNLADWMKCRDFFNDVAYVVNGGKPFTIYNFNTTPLVGKVTPDNPFYLAVNNCFPTFPKNVEVLNKFLKKHKVPEIFIDETKVSGEYVICLDPYYLKSSYNISLITLLIRTVNVNKVITSINDLVEKDLGYGDFSKLQIIKNKNVWFNVPKNLNLEYSYWAGTVYNNKNNCYDVHIIHNNGVLNWYDNMEIHNV